MSASSSSTGCCTRNKRGAHGRLRHEHPFLRDRLAWQAFPMCRALARAGKIAGMTCPELMQELTEKLELKLGFSPEQSAETLADYLGFLQVVSIPKILDAVPRDAEDNAVLETALEGKAQYVVTGDDDLLVLKNFRGIEILRASKFLNVLAMQKG